MPAAVDRALVALLHAERGERGDAGADASDRRAVPEVSVLRRPADGSASAPRGGADRAPRTSAPHPEHRAWPYLLKGLRIEQANHAWCADITYIPVQRGFLYLVAIMDWASRFVLA